MNQLIFDSATKLTAMVRAKEISPVELVEEQIRRIEEVNPKINAYVTTTFEKAIDQARNAEKEIMQGAPIGPLHGLPISVKDTIETAGVRTVSGTRLRETFVPERDATVVERLKRAGAIVLGKTNVPECAMDYRSENPVFGRTNNPWDADRVPGGSSGGEAAAIAAGCSVAGVGSDLGGSIRIPAHFCGITGLKPTPGRIPGSGHFPATTGPFSAGASLGPLARKVEDLRLMYRALVGLDASDPASLPLTARDLPHDLKSLRVMWHADDGIAPVTAATRETLERAAAVLEDTVLEVVDHRPKGLDLSHDLWFDWLARVGSAAIVKIYEGKEEMMGPLVKALKRASERRPLTMDEFASAWFKRDRLRASVISEMMHCQVMLAPVVAVPAFRHDHTGDFDIEGRKVAYLKAFSYAQAYNLLGLPSVAVPCGSSPEGLPIGVQVVGRPFDEETVLRVASLLEDGLGGYKRPPI